MRNQHTVLGEKLASLDHIVAPAAENGGTNDASDLGEKIVVLLQRVRVSLVNL